MMNNTPANYRPGPVRASERYYFHTYEGRVVESIGLLGRPRHHVVDRFVNARVPKISKIKAIYDGNGRLVVHASSGGHYYCEMDEFEQFLFDAAEATP